MLRNVTQRTLAVRVGGALVTVTPGKTIPLSESWAEWELAKYLRAGFVREADPEDSDPEDSDPEGSDPEGSDPEGSREAAFWAAVGQIAEGAPGMWMQDGRPQVSAVNDMLPEGVEHFDASERDAMWAKKPD